MDDAGISFAYARNLAAGHGLVSQPGAAPVERYSNFLWVLSLAVFHRVGLFHAVWTPKITACLLTAGSFLVVGHTLKRATSWGPGIAASALTLVALQPGFVIWSISGLENPLYVFLLCLLMAGLAQHAMATSPSRGNIVFMAVVTGGVAATRPDGMIYAAVVPLVLSVRASMAGSLRPWVRALAMYGAVTTMLLGALVGFRWWYFHDIVPNTYYMKSSGLMGELGHIGSVLWLLPDTVLKIRGLGAAVAGERLGTWVLIIVFAGTLMLVSIRHFHPILAILALFSAVSALAYLLLPLDWMREYRLASPFFLFFYTYVVALAWSVCTTFSEAQAVRRSTFAIVVGLLVAATLVHVARRSVAFASQPNTPLAAVAEQFGHRYNRVAETLGLDSASLLTPDLGGALLHSKLLVIDLGGLCDRTIGRTIGRGQKAFHDHVFEHIRPTFINVHDYWARLAALDGDHRFRRDYVAIRERSIYEKGVPRLEAGDFVRRDALRGPLDPRVAVILGGGF